MWFCRAFCPDGGMEAGDRADPAGGGEPEVGRRWRLFGYVLELLSFPSMTAAPAAI
ncbi:hypothetical protein Pen02_54360 [Plantactinospora endophytica]|uniref:Uncharacterized protein n=1 Tax=Plantactinospora endophytica TaxID=673535 RepID=A0ABQ4E756_9ACTN|nr:hypothetical protein Pen02_54360 [Plantactinospora endophytica]